MIFAKLLLRLGGDDFFAPSSTNMDARLKAEDSGVAALKSIIFAIGQFGARF